MKNAARDALLTDISRRNLGVCTLETRNSDSLDFHECSAAGLKAALEAAYEAGQLAGAREEARLRK